LDSILLDLTADITLSAVSFSAAHAVKTDIPSVSTEMIYEAALLDSTSLWTVK
jgi:hypothetical protein